MNDVEFCYWLQGFFELTNTETITPNQIAIIKEHLKLSETKTSVYLNPTGKGIMSCGLPQHTYNHLEQ